MPFIKSNLKKSAGQKVHWELSKPNMAEHSYQDFFFFLKNSSNFGYGEGEC